MGEVVRLMDADTGQGGGHRRGKFTDARELLGVRRARRIAERMAQDGPDEAGYGCRECSDTGWLVGERGASRCECLREKILSARANSSPKQRDYFSELEGDE